jgi:deoxyribose-phosphate aldolase
MNERIPMTVPAGLPSAIEGTLLHPGIGGDEATRRLSAWKALGVKRVLASPYLLGELAPETQEEVLFAGAVGFPSGTSTLACKRMEMLECWRLGARAATVVLTPALVAARKAADLEREMTLLRSTVPEIELRFLVDCARLSEEALTVLIRLLGSTRPAFLLTADGVYGASAGPERIRWLRDRLSKKVRLAAHVAAGREALAEQYLEAGAALLCAEDPGAILGGRP